VHFDAGSEEISAAGKRIVDGYAQALKANPAAKVELSGHADPSGDAAKNLELAKLRAEKVRGALTAAGVEADRVALVKPADVIVGQGSDADARRVDIILR
jgi:outer membrane protein OmpA-like peptidoglycan-associated protein